jgi:sugar phosphate isomerase/epimerase
LGASWGGQGSGIDAGGWVQWGLVGEGARAAGRAGEQRGSDEHPRPSRRGRKEHRMDSRDQERPTRRDILRRAAAGAAGLCAGPLRALGAAATDRSPKKRKQIPIALQLYSVRRECDKNGGKNFPAVVEAVAKMGYRGVEFAGYYGWKAKDIRKILKDNGLKCAGAHIGLETMLGDQLKRTVEFHKTIGNKFLIVPGLAGKYTGSAKAWLAAAKLFNEIAAKLKPLGMHTGYHNHSHEFRPMGEKTPWDLLFGNTTKGVVMQLDIGNCMGGGGKPVGILKKYPGRALTLHMKEHGGGPKAVLGDGEAPWKEILTLARTIGGTQWYIIEQERYGYPPLECVKRCLAGLRKIRAELE